MSLALEAGPGYDLSAGYFRIANVVYDHYLGQLDVYELRLYQAIARHADRDGKAWLKERTLAAAAGCSVRKVRYGLRALEALGLVVAHPVFDQDYGQRANAYQLCTPPARHLQVVGGEEAPGTAVPPPRHGGAAPPACPRPAPPARTVPPPPACACRPLRNQTHEFTPMGSDRRASAREEASPDEIVGGESTTNAADSVAPARAEELPATATAPAAPAAPEVIAAAPAAPDEAATADNAAPEAVPATAAESAPNSRQKGPQRPATLAKGLMEAWCTVLGDLRETTTPGNYSRWLSQTRLVGYAEGVATVGVPDRVTLEQVRKRFEPLLRWGLTDALGQPVTVRYQLG